MIENEVTYYIKYGSRQVKVAASPTKAGLEFVSQLIPGARKFTVGQMDEVADLLRKQQQLQEARQQYKLLTDEYGNPTTIPLPPVLDDAGKAGLKATEDRLRKLHDVWTKGAKQYEKNVTEIKRLDDLLDGAIPLDESERQAHEARKAELQAWVKKYDEIGTKLKAYKSRLPENTGVQLTATTSTGTKADSKSLPDSAQAHTTGVSGEQKLPPTPSTVPEAQTLTPSTHTSPYSYIRSGAGTIRDYLFGRGVNADEAARRLNAHMTGKNLLNGTTGNNVITDAQANANADIIYYWQQLNKRLDGAQGKAPDGWNSWTPQQQQNWLGQNMPDPFAQAQIYNQAGDYITNTLSTNVGSPQSAAHFYNYGPYDPNYREFKRPLNAYKKQKGGVQDTSNTASAINMGKINDSYKSRHKQRGLLGTPARQMKARPILGTWWNAQKISVPSFYISNWLNSDGDLELEDGRVKKRVGNKGFGFPIPTYDDGRDNGLSSLLPHATRGQFTSIPPLIPFWWSPNYEYSSVGGRGSGKPYEFDPAKKTLIDTKTGEQVPFTIRGGTNSRRLDKTAPTPSDTRASTSGSYGSL